MHYLKKPSVVSPDALDNSQFNLPPVTPSNVGASTIDKAGGLNAQGDYFRQQADLANKQYEDAQKRQDEMLNQLNESQTSAQDFLAQQQDQFKIQEQFNQITNLITEATDIQGNLNNIIEQRDLALIGADGMPISLEHIRGEKELISRKFDARIASESARLSSKQATIQAVQGNISQARSFVNDAVDAMTFDQQQRVDLLGTFIDLNRDTINSLDAKYQNSIRGAMDTANTQLDIAREDAQAKMDLVTQAAQYGVALNVDNMTLEQANQAFAETVAPIANTGTGGAGIEPDEELVGMDAAIRDATDDIINMERLGVSTNEEYWKIVDEIATASGRSREYIDKLISTGWEPTCKCEIKETIPCLVLDPFNGSGTTGVVAHLKSANYVGIDLNKKYIKLSRERLLKDIFVEEVNFNE